MYLLVWFVFLTERKKESEKLSVAPKKSSARRQKALQAEKVTFCDMCRLQNSPYFSVCLWAEIES